MAADDGGGLGGLDDDLPQAGIFLVPSDEEFKANDIPSDYNLDTLDDKYKKYWISLQAAKMSNLVKSIVDADSKTPGIDIKKVRKDILELILVYLKHHDGKTPQEIAKPIRSVKMERIVDDKWDAHFIDGNFVEVSKEFADVKDRTMTKKEIFQVILAANYMDIPSLLHLGCAKIATLIKGKSPEEIKNILADDSNDGGNGNAADQSEKKEQFED